MSILFVHGMGRPGSDYETDSERLQTSWLTALSKGLPDDGAELLDGVSTAYYRDWSWLPDRQAQGGDDGEVTDYMTELAREWLNRASRSSDPDLASAAESAIAKLRPAAHEDQQGLGMMTAAAVVAQLARVPILAEAGLAGLAAIQKTSLWQVDAYVNDHFGSKRRVIDRFSAAIADSSPTVVIAHSLGSVVAYEAIHELALELPLLVTIGSPLGLDRLIYPRLIPSATYPPTVRRWINAADPDDVVAADVSLAVRFPSEATSIRDHSVHNRGFGKWHAATAYLQHDVVRGPILAELRG